MRKRGKRVGFTLSAMLVVIAIIAILAAILFPVFNNVREKARQNQCQSNLSQLAMQVKKYRTDYGHYPIPSYYDTNAGVYVGGFSALFPDYVSDKSIFLCRNDYDLAGVHEAARDRVSCSYNGKVSSPDPNDESSWQFDTGQFTHAQTGTTINGPTRWYNYWGYTNEGVDAYVWANRPYQASVPAWLTSEGYKYNDYPRLMNRQAPDFTVITHCVHHRPQTGEGASQLDIIVRLNGKTDRIHPSAWQSPGNDGVSSWVKQYE